jgi:predicted DNA-binding protein (MmcQ/YjbR family)
MLTPDDIRRTALALPEAYEEPHFEIASFRVAKKIFCTIHVDQPRIMLKLTPEDQHNLSDGEVIEPVPGYWGRGGSTFVWYEKLEPARLAGLMRLAWAGVAPKRLTRA